MEFTSHAEHKRHTFDSFCKKVLKFDSRNYDREMNYLRGHEKSLPELSAVELERLSYADEYPSDYRSFETAGYTVGVRNQSLANAIAALPDEKRDIILLSFFLDMTDGEIADTLNLVRRSVHRKRKLSLQELKKLLESEDNKNE